jgi:hypothetical protein
MTGDFLAAWVVELVVHHLDLGRELEVGAPATAAMSLTVATVEICWADPYRRNGPKSCGFWG